MDGEEAIITISAARVVVFVVSDVRARNIELSGVNDSQLSSHRSEI